MNPEQLTYVKNELARGVRPEDLRTVLTQSGYDAHTIEQLFLSAGAVTPMAVTHAPGIPSDQANQPAPTSNVSYSSSESAQTNSSGMPKWLRLTLIGIAVLVGLTAMIIFLVQSFISNAVNTTGVDFGSMVETQNNPTSAQNATAVAMGSATSGRKCTGTHNGVQEETYTALVAYNGQETLAVRSTTAAPKSDGTTMYTTIFSYQNDGLRHSYGSQDIVPIGTVLLYNNLERSHPTWNAAWRNSTESQVLNGTCTDWPIDLTVIGFPKNAEILDLS